MQRLQTSTRKSNQVDLSLATRAVWLSYIGGCTQSDIARRLKVSPAKAHRLIAQAQDLGLVRVFIEGEPEECLALEETIGNRFELEGCVVAPDLGSATDSDLSDFLAVGAAAARYLVDHLASPGPHLVGIGKGRTLSAMVDHLPAMERPDLKFVSVSGSLTRSLAANPFDVVHRLIERTGGEGYFLPVPYIAANAEEKEVLLAQRSVQDMLALARQAEIYLVGIGAMTPDAHVRQVGMVSDTEWNDLCRLNAVGDLMGCFLDAAGRPVDATVNHHALGLGIEEMRGRRIVAVAAGAAKAQAILAALKTGVITDLVIDEQAARPIAEMSATEENSDAQ